MKHPVGAIEHIPLLPTIAHCDEDVFSTCIIRKFKSDCGNLIEISVTRKNGFIRSIKPVYDCRPNCPECADRIAKIRKLIASENEARNH